jgi:hypothetical protein
VRQGASAPSGNALCVALATVNMAQTEATPLLALPERGNPTNGASTANGQYDEPSTKSTDLFMQLSPGGLLNDASGRSGTSRLSDDSGRFSVHGFRQHMRQLSIRLAQYVVHHTGRHLEHYSM